MEYTVKKRITILHPDLGIGGAERLVLDAALAYKEAGHKVSIVTNHFSEFHCFEDALKFKNDIKVISWFPRSLFSRFCALFAYIRLCLAALYVVFCQDVDVIFMDSISFPLVIFSLFSWYNRPYRIFYCHFPDLLLTKRETTLKKFYRFFVDNLERWSIKYADKIYVNSHFTKSICEQEFPALKNVTLHVLYPTLRTESLQLTDIDEKIIPKKFQYVFLSINRYEIKKNIILAIEAFDDLRCRLMNVELFKTCVLVVAGGYDPLNEENKLYYEKLRKLVDDLMLNDNVIFLKSPSDKEKAALLHRAQMVIYTPRFEHFGIVPLEAMFTECCVLAVNAGGPTETVKHGETGFLTDDSPKQFARFMKKVIDNQKRISDMGKKGKQRVLDNFSYYAFSRQLVKEL